MRLPLLPLLLGILLSSTQALAASLQTLREARLWQRAEFRVDGLPAVGNPFDPDEIRVDARLQSPSGKVQLVPAFWYQVHESRLVDGVEQVTAAGTPEWRLRYTATEPGDYRLVLLVSLKGGKAEELTATVFTVTEGSAPEKTGWVRVSADQRGFETGDGRPLRLIGENVCWPGDRGLAAYEDYFSAMQASGQNFARLWMAPWWGGLEHKPGRLNRYALDEAWRLDRVFELAEAKGLYLMLCFDHHGMYQIGNKNWGGSNNFWPQNPYSVEQGGPCGAPNDFFAMPAARRLYEKRLRYLVARYGSSPMLHSWQFFNEIDNVIRFLKESDVLDWHRAMARSLKAMDPYGHLVTTSLTGSSDRPVFWMMPEMDFAIYHSYAEASLGAGLARRSADAVERYKKPFLIGEFGVNGAAWHREEDPFLRGFRQALWGGALGGSAGVSLTWWWESVHAENVYPLFQALHTLLSTAGWDRGSWELVPPADQAPRPTEVGSPLPGAEPFTATLTLQGSRLSKLTNSFAVTDRLASARSAEQVSAFLHGARFAELRAPHRLSVNLAEKARLKLRVKMVGGSAELVLRLDGRELERQAFGTPSGDNPAYQVVGKDLSFELPAGRHLLELRNEGFDWIILESLILENVLPSSIAGDWHYEPEIFGLRQKDKAVLYVVSREVIHPANALLKEPTEQKGMRIQLPNMPSGAYRTRVFSPVDARELASLKLSVEKDRLEFTLPDFTEDLVVIVSKE